LQQALEALESDEFEMVPDRDGHMVFRREVAITALRERLTQKPEQSDEGVCDGCSICNSDDFVPISADGRSVFIDGVGMVPLAFANKSSAEPVCVQGKLWLWRNHVDGRPEYWAFENPFPVHENGDPQTLGEPCGYALLKASRNGRPDVSDEEVIRKIKLPKRTPLTDETLLEMWVESPSDVLRFARAIERKHGIGEKK
jgi:hypothetical protein